MADRIYCEKHRVNFYNADQNGNLLLSTYYLNWCAEIAGTHLETRGIYRNDMLEEDQVFLLTKVSYLCFKPARYGDIVTLKTWEHSLKGAHFFRCFALEKDGERLCESISSWSLVAPKDRRVLRPTDYKHEFLLTEHPITAQITRNKVGELPEVASHVVTFTETDGNGHLNNSNYGDFIVDNLPQEYAEKLKNGAVIARAEISFLREAKQSDRIGICAADIDGSIHMYGCFEDGKRCFEAVAEVR